MNKHILFIPFLALLGTSCSGAHITTTPLVRNAPSVILNTKKPSKQPSQKQASPNPTYNDGISMVNLGDFTYQDFNSTDPSHRQWISTEVLPNAQIPADNSTILEGVCGSCVVGSQIDVYTHAYPFVVALRQTGHISIYWEDYTDYGFPNTIKEALTGKLLYYKNNGEGTSAYTSTYTKGFNEGKEEGLEDGYIIGYQEGEAYNNPIIQNGQYAGLTAFPRRNYLKILARRVVSGLEQLQDGHFDLIDTNANYTIYIKWSYSYPKTTFKDYGNTIIGELYWTDIISGNWSTSWFGKYDPELHQILGSPKYYATDAPIAMSFYPEVYLGSTIVGDVDLFFMGTANDYALGFADGQTYTIQASETYNNIFTIFTPAFRAVANFFNLNIGPFKIWYFFAIPLIVTLLILVLRLVKH